jgi:hypothetical protein
VNSNPPNKVNLKKYLAIGDCWQFVPVLRVNGIPKPAYVLVQAEPMKEPAGTLYLEWRSDGKRIQLPCGELFPMRRQQFASPCLLVCGSFLIERRHGQRGVAIVIEQLQLYG